MKRSLSPLFSPLFLACVHSGPLCSEIHWGGAPLAEQESPHAPSLPHSTRLRTPPHLPHPFIHGRTPFASPLGSLNLIQQHHNQLRLSPVTSMLPVSHLLVLGQPSWMLRGCSRGLVPCCNSNSAQWVHRDGVALVQEQRNPCMCPGLKAGDTTGLSVGM